MLLLVLLFAIKLLAQVHITKKKMPFLGLTHETSKWYTSYLSNKKLIISIENVYLDKASVTRGV